MNGAYGPMPTPQQPAPGQWGRPPRPPQVVWACRLLVLNVVLGVIGTIVVLTMTDQLRSKIESQNDTFDHEQIDSVFNTIITVSVIVGLAFGAFYLFLAYKMWRGRNWARITTWVFAGLGVFGLISALVRPSLPASTVLGVIGGLDDIAIIILLALRPSNEFFRRPPPAYGYGQPGYPPVR